jgi:hypothetical protein
VIAYPEIVCQWPDRGAGTDIDSISLFHSPAAQIEMPQEIPPLRLIEDVFDYDSDDNPDFVPCGDLDEFDGEAEGMPVDGTNSGPDLVNPSIQEAARRASNRRNQGRSILRKVQAVCKLLTDLDLSIGDFIHALSWGDPECTADDVVRYHWMALLQNDLLPILQNWNKPPYTHKYTGRGTEITKTFAVECVTEVVQEEMKTISKLFQSDPDPLSLASLMSFNFSETATKLKKNAPVLWHILKKVGWSVRQAQQNTHKTPENVNFQYKYICGTNSIYCRSLLTSLECYHSADHCVTTDLQHYGPSICKHVGFLHVPLMHSMQQG